MLWKHKRIFAENPIDNNTSDTLAIISDLSSSVSGGVCDYNLINNVLVQKTAPTSMVVEQTDIVLNTTFSAFNGNNQYWKISWYGIEYTIKINTLGEIIEVPILC